jgi:hypothetical protein
MKEKIAHETGMNQSDTFKSSDIIGDNIDITRSPSEGEYTCTMCPN